MVTSIRALYVGRNARVVEQLRTLFQAKTIAANDDVDGEAYRLDLNTASNQKTALAMMRKQPPSIIFVETDSKPNSRLRFCEMARYRLPTAVLLSVSKSAPDTPFAFGGHLLVPIEYEPALKLIRHICLECADYRLQQGHLTLNVATRTVSTPDGRYHMTPKQCALLRVLMERAGEVVTRAELMKRIWDTDFLDDTRTLDVHIRWLRERIEPEPSAPTYLLTVRGIGYQLAFP